MSHSGFMTHFTPWPREAVITISIDNTPLTSVRYAAPPEIRACYLSDENLLAAWQQLADMGRPFAQIRVDAIKARMRKNEQLQ